MLAVFHDSGELSAEQQIAEMRKLKFKGEKVGKFALFGQMVGRSIAKYTLQPDGKLRVYSNINTEANGAGWQAYVPARYAIITDHEEDALDQDAPKDTLILWTPRWLQYKEYPAKRE